MQLPSFENFLFIPSSATAGTLYALSPAAAFATESFVMIPYQDPQVKAIQPQFYKVIQTVPIQDLETRKDELPPMRLKPGISKADYVTRIKDLKRQIQRGNIYEINYCIRFTAEHVTVDPLQVFLRLYALSKAPYSALLKLGNEFILCASPELFIQKNGSSLCTKPIKGTTRRGSTAGEDERLKTELYNSLKERTENVMAVDVARNDLSQFATRGSVKVNKLYNIETFETVHQMVSTISCDIKEGITFADILHATFPMASMTGAPKLRAMQLIGETESFTRHYYSGAMGLIDAKGDYTLPVIIRSIFYNRAETTVSIAVGGAITYLSEPEQEYEECLLKANALLKALNATIDQ